MTNLKLQAFQRLKPGLTALAGAPVLGVHSDSRRTSLLAWEAAVEVQADHRPMASLLWKEESLRQEPSPCYRDPRNQPACRTTGANSGTNALEYPTSV